MFPSTNPVTAVIRRTKNKAQRQIIDTFARFVFPTKCRPRMPTNPTALLFYSTKHMKKKETHTYAQLLVSETTPFYVHPSLGKWSNLATLQETKLSHHSKRKIIFKNCLVGDMWFFLMKFWGSEAELTTVTTLYINISGFHIHWEMKSEPYSYSYCCWKKSG